MGIVGISHHLKWAFALDPSICNSRVATGCISIAKTQFTELDERGPLRCRKLINGGQLKPLLRRVFEADLQGHSMLDERFPRDADLVISDDALDTNEGPQRTRRYHAEHNFDK